MSRDSWSCRTLQSTWATKWLGSISKGWFLLSISGQGWSRNSGNIYLSIYLIIQVINPSIGAISKWKYLLLLKLWCVILQRYMVKNQSLWLDLRISEFSLWYKLNFPTPISLQPDDVNLCYFKYRSNTSISLKYIRTTTLGLAKIKPYSKI